jgi:hypothetical protein
VKPPGRHPRPNVSSFCCTAGPMTSASARTYYFFGVSSNGLLDGNWKRKSATSF